MGSLRIIDPGMKAYVEDLGRWGYQRYGVSVSGAADEMAARTANFLAGNTSEAAVIEITLKGISLEFEGDAVFALTGGPCGYTLNGSPVALWRSYRAKAGDILAGGFLTGGLRNYLAVSGGIDVPVIMGSRSTNLRGRFGGFQGRELRKNDFLPFFPPTGAAASAKTLPLRALEPEKIPVYGAEAVIRVIPGPQAEAVTEAGMRAFLTTAYQVSFDSDRMGIRLAGERIEHVKGADIISDGTTFGSIQAPGDGQPIVMLAECQTTGGYCKIATAISADRSKLAQARPKSRLRFQAVSEEEALAEMRNFFLNFNHLDRYCPVVEG